MAVVTINLSDDELSLAREQATKEGFSGIEAWLRDLVTERLGTEDVEACGAPQHLQVSSMEQLKALVREGLNGSGRTFTEADLAQMRHELIDTGRISKA